MKIIQLFLISILFIACSNNRDNSEADPDSKKVKKRVGMVIGIKPEVIDEYKRLHDDNNPGVRDLLNIANFANFSIFIHQFDEYQFDIYCQIGTGSFFNIHQF